MAKWSTPEALGGAVKRSASDAEVVHRLKGGLEGIVRYHNQSDGCVETCGRKKFARFYPAAEMKLTFGNMGTRRYA